METIAALLCIPLVGVCLAACVGWRYRSEPVRERRGRGS